MSCYRLLPTCFNTQPPKGGWRCELIRLRCLLLVSTHSRLKAAGAVPGGNAYRDKVSTHSRLKAAGINVGNQRAGISVSTHSRLKAAGLTLSFHTEYHSEFQHTAA